MAQGVITNEQAARRYFEYHRWHGCPVCPFCKKAETVKILNSKSMGEGWYHCRECRLKFTVRVGTIMARSHITLGKWLDLFSILFEADRNHRRLKVSEVSHVLEITRKSARLMLDRIKPQNEPRLRSWDGPVWWER
jgi:transposase-like protein